MIPYPLKAWLLSLGIAPGAGAMLSFLSHVSRSLLLLASLAPACSAHIRHEAASFANN